MSHADLDTLATANESLDAPRRMLRDRLTRRLRGGPMAPFTGGPKGRFLFVRDLSDRPEGSVLVLSGALGTEVGRGEAAFAAALMSGGSERVVGDWRRTHTTLTFFVEGGSVTPRELAELLEGTGAEWSIAVAEVPRAARGAA